jgi:hypothetical protein
MSCEFFLGALGAPYVLDCNVHLQRILILTVSCDSKGLQPLVVFANNRGVN